MTDIDTLISLCKRRGFIFPSSEIYGGFANSWDYGPLGVELKNNIKRAWWKCFVHGRDDVVGIDASILMNPSVWQASGHTDNFADPLVDCKSCKRRFRADNLLEQKSLKPDLGTMKQPPAAQHLCPECGGELTDVRTFNLMFKTYVGPVEDQANVAYLRPETAQAMFVDFRQIVDSTRMKLPFGVAQIGKAFRNEITPGNYIFRTREFEIMEIEYYVRKHEWQRHFDHWRGQIMDWIAFAGIDANAVHEQEIQAADRAHYSERTIDFEFDFPFGRKELYGLAYRTDFDLSRHASMSGRDLAYADPDTGESIIPHVIEPTFGVERTLLAVMLSSYHEEQARTAVEGETERRVVLRLPSFLAPYQIAVLPLSKKAALCESAHRLASDLRKDFTVEYDETQSIGRRYRRQDEIGTPYCITVDFDSLSDHKATVRDRDSMRQDRVAMSQLQTYLTERLHV